MLTVDTDPLFVSHRPRLVEFAAQQKLPSMYGLREFVDAGGLMAYSTSIFALWRRAAYYADRIIKGTRPADLPVEQPEKFKLVHQPEDREGPWPDHSAVGAGAGG